MISIMRTDPQSRSGVGSRWSITRTRCRKPEPAPGWNSAASGPVGRIRTCRQAVAPAVPELRPVEELVGLDSRFDATAGRHPFVVNDLRERLVDHLVSRVANSERQVGVFVIRWTEEGVESAQTIEELREHHQAGTRAVIDLAREVVPGVVRVVELSVVGAGGVAPDQPSRLLKSAVGIHQLGTRDSRPGNVLERLNQRLQPAGSDHRIVVQEGEEGPRAASAPRLQEPMNPRF